MLFEGNHVIKKIFIAHTASVDILLWELYTNSVCVRRYPTVHSKLLYHFVELPVTQVQAALVPLRFIVESSAGEIIYL